MLAQGVLAWQIGWEPGNNTLKHPLSIVNTTIPQSLEAEIAPELSTYLPSSDRLSHNPGQMNQGVDSDRVLSLSLLMLLLYTTVGFCLACLGTSFWLWTLTVFIYHLNLASLEVKECDREKIHVSWKTLPTILYIVPITFVFTELTDVGKSGLQIYNSLALGLTTAISSLGIITVLVKYLGKVEAIILSTGLSWLGFSLGWMIQNFSRGF